MADDTSTSQGNSDTGTGENTPAPAGGTGSQQQGSVSTAPPAAQSSEGQSQGVKTPEGGDAAKDGAADLELKAPEGLDVDPTVLESFRGKAKELGLDSEQAQSLLDFYSQVQREALQAAQKQVDGWLEAVRRDKELGGAALKETQQHALRCMAKFATPELKQFLDRTGLGNHPEMVRFVARIGKLLAEDSVHGASSNAETPSNDKEALLRRMYPTMYPQAG